MNCERSEVVVTVAVNRMDGLAGLKEKKLGERMREAGWKWLRERWWVIAGHGFFLFGELFLFYHPPLLLCWYDDSYGEDKKKWRKKRLEMQGREVV